jgi:hypothetical protein
LTGIAPEKSKNLDSPDESLVFKKEKIQITNLGNSSIAKVTLDPDGAGHSTSSPE